MKKITVSLIAEKAQVSPATVSRVLNHRELVKEPTIRRVEEAMRSLGCQIENTVTVSKETQPLIVRNRECILSGDHPGCESICKGTWMPSADP